MLPEWNRDVLWSKDDARTRRRRGAMKILTIVLLGIGLGVANQACYELLQHGSRPAAELVRTIPTPGLR